MEIDKQKLLDNFNELLSIEVKARDYYDGLLKNNIPKSDRRAIIEIRNDEKHHMRIAQSIIDIISKDKNLLNKAGKL